jgi:SAM-dependent methyltransferase
MNLTVRSVTTFASARVAPHLPAGYAERYAAKGCKSVIDYSQLAVDYARHRKVHSEAVRSLVSDARLTASSRVLDIGCGTGNYAMAVHEAVGCQCWGIDPSIEMLALAAPESTSVQFQPGDAEELDFDDGSLDFVFSVDVIHHVVDHFNAYREAYRVLDSGGRICTVTDSEWIIRNRLPLATYFPDTIEIDLARYPSLATLKQIMAQVGFIKINHKTVYLPYNTTDIQIYRDKAFSCLRLIGEDAFRDGIISMEEDLKHGPIECVSRYSMLWGTKSCNEAA